MIDACKNTKKKKRKINSEIHRARAIREISIHLIVCQLIYLLKCERDRARINVDGFVY